MDAVGNATGRLIRAGLDLVTGSMHLNSRSFASIAMAPHDSGASTGPLTSKLGLWRETPGAKAEFVALSTSSDALGRLQP